jgi:UDP-GlcNAc:undecaprenyl-phosphate GlcNAc-1-phosphate transferase
MLGTFLISFLVTALLTPAVIAGAHRLGWVARPREDRWHRRPTALMGGVAIFLGTLAAWATLGRGGLHSPLLIPAAGIFLLGAVDDRIHLRPYLKLIGQVAAAAFLVLNGPIIRSLPPYLALPVTIFWIVGITNAVNLLDNMDGLAAGVSAISALAMGAFCLGRGDLTTAQMACALAGGAAGFLIYNFNPARVFMGDCGSMFLGFSLAGLALDGTQRSAPNLVLTLLVPVAVLAIPIFDTTLVSVSRVLNGRSVSQGGRDHSSHRLVALGLSERGAVLVFYALTALFGGLALAATRFSLIVVSLVAVLLAIGLLVLGLYLGVLKVYKDLSEIPSHARVIGGTLRYKKQMLQVCLDLVLVIVSFTGAHLLRFEGEIPQQIRATFVASLPLLLTAKLLGLAFARAYRGVWRYAGMIDALTAITGSTLGSLMAAAAFGWLTGFHGLSKAALITDWILFTVLAVTVRMWYIALRELFGSLPARNAPKVLILGAGEEAWSLILRLRDPVSSKRADVVGILDDGLAYERRSMNGVPILGPVSALPNFAEQHEIACCLLGVDAHSEAARRALLACSEAGISLYQDLDTPLLSPPENALAAAHS